jgi:hypothetical protein
MSLFPLGLLSQGGGAGGTPAYQLISSQILGSNTTTVTFSSIPATYKHLRLVFSGRSSTAGTGFSNVLARINGVSTASYWWNYIEVSGSTYSVVRQSTAQTSGQMGFTQNNGHTSGWFSGHELEIPDYASTTVSKTGRFLSRTDSVDNVVAYTSYGSFVSVGTSAVSSVSFTLSSGDWIATSRFSLYGISG